MQTFREWLNEAKILISEDFILKTIKKFKLKKDNFIVWDRTDSRGYKNYGIALDKNIFLYYIMGEKVKIEYFGVPVDDSIMQYQNYTVKDGNGFYFTKELKSEIILFFNELAKEIDTHYLDTDIKQKQAKYPNLLF